ncbi:unnamed protein product [Prunus armeniaca]
MHCRAGLGGAGRVWAGLGGARLVWAELGRARRGGSDNNYRELAWGALDDVVMGGISESTFQIDPNGGENGGPTGIFKGVVSTANNGGFTSIRTKNLSTAEDLSAYDGLELRLKGDGRHYKLIVRTSRDWDTVGYTAGFDTVGDQWQTVGTFAILFFEADISSKNCVGCTTF